MIGCRHNDDTDDDDDQHGNAFVSATHLVRQSNRHLHGRLLRVRLHRSTGVRGRQLHVLGHSQRAPLTTSQTTDQTAPRRR